MKNPLYNNLLNAIKVLKEKESYAIVHSYGDFDSFAAAMIFKDLFNSKIVITDKLNSVVKRFAQNLGIEYYNYKDLNFQILQSKLVIALDSSDHAMLPKQISSYYVVIDHHVRMKYVNSKFLFNFPEQTSVCEIILDSLTDDLINKISKRTALAIACAIYSDTYKLKSANNLTIKHFNYILEKFDIDLAEVKRLCFPQFSYEEKLALITASQRIEYITIGRYIFAISYLSAYEGEIANAMLKCGADIAIVFHYDKKHGNKITIRVCEAIAPKIQVASTIATIANKYNVYGGGHNQACGIIEILLPCF
ncbi:MAG: DHH family phosphoesterase, partial [Candidatus Anstonellales archaeon]